MLPRPWFRTKSRSRAYSNPTRKSQPAHRRLTLEQLEDRTLLAGNVLANATALTLPASNVVRASDFIDNTSNVDLFSVQLNQGDRVTVDLDTQSIGSGLNSYLRVFFDPDGLGVGAPARQIAANDDFDGRDSRLTFQASVAGDYFIGVSSSGNENYDPADGAAATAGTTHGLFELIVTRTAQAVPPQPDLVGAVLKFRKTQQWSATHSRSPIGSKTEGGRRPGPATGSSFSCRRTTFLKAIRLIDPWARSTWIPWKPVSTAILRREPY